MKKREFQKTIQFYELRGGGPRPPIGGGANKLKVEIHLKSEFYEGVDL